MSEPVKQGKVSISERDKYTQATVQPGDVLTIPEQILSHIENMDLVAKWVSKAKIATNGGRHPSGWIPYELNDTQKASIKGYGMGILNGHCLERGDMVLGVKPVEAHEAHAKVLREKVNRQIDSYYEMTDAAGQRMLDRGKKPV